MTGYTVRRCEQLETFSRDNRARIATCSLRTLTDRLKANYSIDECLVWVLKLLQFVVSSAFDVAHVAKKVGATQFLDLVKDADLSKTLESLQNFTVFLPTNQAVQVISHSGITYRIFYYRFLT